MPQAAVQSPPARRQSCPARAAYVHVPFCARRCGYCNFTLVAGRDDLIERYLEAIERELSWLEQPRPVDTLFIGGGTPSYLPPAQLARLLRALARWFPLAPQEGFSGEFSIEGNPADMTDELVEVLIAHGVTRISLGAQSFNPEKLTRLERDHSPAEVRQAFRIARRLPSVSLDLIFAAPGETLAGWAADLDAAIELEPDHISTYGLTFERGTTFWNRLAKGQLARAEEELERQMYELAIDRLTAAGFEQYEVSNFARPGQRCRHNEAYWLGESYFAAGPGAARYLDGTREMNHRSTTTYLARVLAGESPVAESETLSPEDSARELLVFGLRRLEGVDREWFSERTGYSLDELGGAALREYVDRGLLADDGRCIRLTRAGLLVSDALWPRLLHC